jgi:hypothetical protein
LFADSLVVGFNRGGRRTPIFSDGIELGEIREPLGIGGYVGQADCDSMSARSPCMLKLDDEPVREVTKLPVDDFIAPTRACSGGGK